MADKKPSVNFITPRGVFIFPKLNKPDDYRGDVRYKVKLRVSPDDIPAELTEKLEALRDEWLAKVKAELTEKKQGAKLKGLTVLDVFQPEINKETGDETGFVLIYASMKAEGTSKKDGKPWKRAPKIFTAGGKKLSPGVQIWGGTEGKLSIKAIPYDMVKDKTATNVGLSFQLEAVQILKLVSGSDKDAAGYGFGVEEGYTDEPDEGGEQFAASEASNPQSGQAGSGDDF